jgi:hypothetical protein
MRYIGLFISLILLLGCQTKQINHQNNFTKDSINPVLGNKSFVKKFHRLPNTSDSELERIQAHLFYVEGLLRKNSSKIKDPKIRKKRSQFLDLLKEYAEAGSFPKNEEYKNRRPCFIDSKGTYCAVGYLVKESAGEEAAHLINEKHQYDYIYDMDMELLDKWIKDAGFSKKEVAMIQPTYEHLRGSKKYLGVSPRLNYRNYDGFDWGIGIHYFHDNGYEYYRRLSVMYQHLFGGESYELEFTRTLKRHQKLPFDIDMGLAAQYYTFSSNNGLNITPKVGISRIFWTPGKFLLQFDSFYQYDIPVSNAAYPINRYSINMGFRLNYRCK